jgi:hypothetical protein
MTSFINRARSYRRGVSALLLLIYLPACASWHLGTPNPAQFVETERPEQVRVTRTDGSSFTLASPSIRGDSLIGRGGGGLSREDSARTVAVPLSDVSKVEVRKTSVGKTLAMVGGVLAALLIIGCATTSGGGYVDPC